MKENIYRYRGEMLHLFLEKDLSTPTKNKIAILFKNLEEDEKEELAKKIIPLIKTSKDEPELLKRVGLLKRKVVDVNDE